MQRTVLVGSLLLLGGGITAVSAQDCAEGQTEVTVRVLTDNYPAETSWEIRALGTEVLLASRRSFTARTEHINRVCATDGISYRFTIFDAEADGICCGYGNGSYSVSIDGVEIQSGGNFQASESVVFQTGTPVANDLALIANTTRGFGVAGDPAVFKGRVRNMGSAAVSSYSISYALDGGSATSHVFNESIPVGGEADFELGWAPPGAAGTTHGYSLSVDQVNGVADQNAGNNGPLSGRYLLTSDWVQRVALLEQHTSSTCGPCASINTTLSPALTRLSTNLAGSRMSSVKYHQTYPSPGTDPSANSDARSRHDFYGVTGIPALFMNGVRMNSIAEPALWDGWADSALVDLRLSGSFDYVNNSLSVRAEVTPFAGFVGQHRLHIMVTENAYNYAGTTSQRAFHYALRKALPTVQGTTLATLTMNETQVVEESFEFTVGNPNPTQGSNQLWSGGNNLTVVAFVQNHGSKQVMQAAILPASAMVGVRETNELDQSLSVFPNPAADMLNVAYATTSGGSAHILITNMLGQKVMEVNTANGRGEQLETLSLQGLQQGLYHVTILKDGLRATRTVSVVR